MKRVKLECEFANQVRMDGDFEIPLRREDNERISAINILTAREMCSLFFPSFRRIEGGFARVPRHIPTIDMIRYEADSFSQIFAG